jgi:hypothetical protein
MTEDNRKIIFYLLAAFMLFAMLFISQDAGISGDEEVHYKQSEMVYNYFSTLGKDQSSLNTPKTHLKYYGQTFDNMVTGLIHIFGIEDIYAFRHLMCSISGWLTIVVTALFAAYFSGYGAAILVLILFAVSPATMWTKKEIVEFKESVRKEGGESIIKVHFLIELLDNVIFKPKMVQNKQLLTRFL